MVKIPFTKMHGCGNDYIYVWEPNAEFDKQDSLRCIAEFDKQDSLRCIAARAWSDRHKGIGSDGLVLIGRSPVADFSMRIFNADGSEAKMCGNACRCIGKYVYERGLTDKTEVQLQTAAGIKMLRLHVNNNKVERVTVDMGEPAFEDVRLFTASLDSGRGCFVSMGNPHYVVFTDDVDSVEQLGRELERHPAFPERCNVEFARIDPDGRIRTRVWERGSGITQACGTGACATAVAAARTGRAGRASTIVMDGGQLSVEWREADGHVLLSGPAAFVFDGEIDAGFALN